MVVDATGIKGYGEGEWKVSGHGWSKRRTWKGHVGVDQANGQIMAAAVTTDDCSDGQLLPELLDQIDADIVQVLADSAYDRHACYTAISMHQAPAAIPSRGGARIWRHGNSKALPLACDKNLRDIRRLGCAAWKHKLGYHRRSKALDGGVWNQDPLR